MPPSVAASAPSSSAAIASPFFALVQQQQQQQQQQQHHHHEGSDEPYAHSQSYTRSPILSQSQNDGSSHARSRSRTVSAPLSDSSFDSEATLPLSSSDRDQRSYQQSHGHTRAPTERYAGKQHLSFRQYHDNAYGDDEKELAYALSGAGEESSASAGSSGNNPRRRRSLFVWLGGSAVAVCMLLLLASGTSTQLASSATGSSPSSSHAVAPNAYLPAVLNNVLHPRREAIATLLTSPTFLPPVLALGHSLNRFEPTRDHVLLITNTSVFEPSQLTMLQRNGWLIRVVEHIPVTDTATEHVRDRYRDVMNKLHIWNMTEYEAVGLLDGDTILVGSVSQPFDFLHMSDYPLAAVPDISGPGGGPRHLEIKNNLNAGAMWAKTNATLFTELVEASKHTATYDPRFPEQNFLTRFFSGRWLGLDVGYNLMLLYVKDGRRKYYDRVRPHAKVLHYAADSKPWRRCLRGNMHLCMIDHLRWVKNVRDAMDEVGVTPADFAAAGWKLQPVFDATAAKIADLLPGDRA